MYGSTLIRIGAVAAILGGTLRAIASFIPETTPNVFLLYFVIDLCLLFSVLGFYRFTESRTKLCRLLGPALMFLASAVLIARDLGIAPPTIYAVAAALFSIGLDVFAIYILRSRKMPIWIPVAWITSTIAGPLGFFVPELHLLFASSGLIFGIAFAGAGVVMWRSGV